MSVGNFQLLTHAAPKQQLFILLSIYLASIYLAFLWSLTTPPCLLVWVEVSEGWDTTEQVEGRVRKQPGDGEICFNFLLAQSLLHR